MARKILLADDSVTAQNMGRKILADAGYEVTTVNNGSAALKKIAEIKPDLIVLDVYMPGYSGLEVCQRLKDVGETARIPVLLTVGKLEPFKPDEAKRVHADGFIVKPFEASELLSALSKLEDKVVPRAENSKPGRFARATAAIEEGRHDRSMDVEEDSGWKSRISFPSKKKDKPQEKEVDTAEIYNPVNKDLRTIVEHNAPEHAPVPGAAPHEEDKHVNVGALAPEGLPKDVTPEEIAALAAAAAHIKGKVADEKPAAGEMAVTAAPVEPAKSETVETVTAAVEPAQVESKNEETQPAEAAPSAAADAMPATFAAQEAPEKAEEKKPEHKSGPAEVMAAIAGLETEWVSVPFAGAGEGSPVQSGAKQEEPVTMAAAAGAGVNGTVSRWSAVAVTLAPEEATVSLEQEMQKAHAAFAAAEGKAAAAEPPTPEIVEPTSPETTTTVTEITDTPAVFAEAPPAETSVMEEAPAPPPVETPETVQPAVAVPEPPVEMSSAVVKEMEVVGGKFEAETSTAATESAAEGSLQTEAVESPAPPDLESKPEEKEEKSEVRAESEEQVEAKADDKVVEQPAERAEALVQTPEDAPVIEAAAPQVAPQEQAEVTEKEVTEKKEEPLPVAEAPEVVAKVEVSEEIPQQNPSSEAVLTEPVADSSVSTRGGADEMAKRESETAAAWASWRKIRETGNGKSAPAAEEPVKEPEAPVSEDKAAMAVAAGAESKPEEATAALESDPEIASIVDSVLADMRPKIVEEIARKLGKKK